MLEMSVPWPPSVNRIWRAFGKRIILSAAARQYKLAFRAALPKGRAAPPLTGRLMVWMTLHPPAKLAKGGQPWDIMNREKLLCDCMTKQRIWVDDSQIDAAIITRGIPCASGRVDITIHTIPDGSTGI